MPIEIQFPPKLRPLFSPAPYKAPRGGRGSAKSWGIARALLLLGGKSKLRWLCTREYQKSIKDSVHKLLKDQIERLGMSKFYEATDKTITGRNGTEFIFAGLHANMNAIKSLEGCDGCWVEEAETVSEESWTYLLPTIRKDSAELAHAYGLTGTVPAEVWVSFNPREATDPTSQKFMVNPLPNTMQLELNWRDNPWFPENLRAQMEHCKKTDFDAYEWIWEGKFRKHSKAQIMADKCRIEEFDPYDSNGRVAQGWDGPWGGMDFGFAQDPFSAHKYWSRGKTLYVEHELYEVGLELDKIPESLDRSIPGCRRLHFRADCSRPETISHLSGKGFNVVASKKWSGCVEDGISALRSLDAIVIHPRCKGAILESSSYKWKVNKLTEEISSTPEDKFNHFWDDCRYAMEPFIVEAEHEHVIVHEEQVSVSPELDEFEASFSTGRF